MGHVRDRWTRPGENGRRVRTERWGHGKRWQAHHTDEAGRRESATFTTKDEAALWVAQREAGVPEIRRPGSGPLLAEWAHRWRRSQLHWRATTAQSAQIAIDKRIIPELGHHPLGQVTRRDVQDAAAAWASRYSTSTIRVTFSYLAAMLKDAVTEGILQASPAVGIRLPRTQKQRLQLLTVEQVEALQESMTGRLREALVVAAATGLRPGEWRSLTWDRVDLEAGTVTVDRQLGQDGTWVPPKSAAGVRTIMLGRVACEALDRQREAADGGLVFTTRRGRPYGRGDLSHAWTRATVDDGGRRWEALPKRSGWHDLRHFHASLLIANGMSVRAVADRLGHSDISETLGTYAHLWPSDDERSAGIVDGALGMLGASRERPDGT